MTRQTLQPQKKRGPAATGIGAPVQVRLHPHPMASLDAWIAAQPEPRPTRPEAIRRLLADALEGRRPIRTTDHEIACEKRTIAGNPEKGEPSPAKNMPQLRRGLAETKLRSLKARKGGPNACNG